MQHVQNHPNRIYKLIYNIIFTGQKKHQNIQKFVPKHGQINRFIEISILPVKQNKLRQSIYSIPLTFLLQHLPQKNQSIGPTLAQIQTYLNFTLVAPATRLELGNLRSRRAPPCRWWLSGETTRTQGVIFDTVCRRNLIIDQKADLNLVVDRLAEIVAFPSLYCPPLICRSARSAFNRWCRPLEAV